MEALIVASWSSITSTTKNVTTVKTNCAQELNFQIMSTELFMQVCCFTFNNFNFQSFLDSTYAMDARDHLRLLRVSLDGLTMDFHR